MSALQDSPSQTADSKPKDKPRSREHIDEAETPLLDVKASAVGRAGN
jgi:hypothetical protein